MTTAGASESLAPRLAGAGLDWIIPRWPVSSRVQGFVTTRNGGVSTGACASLDLGNAPTTDAARSDAGAAIAENERRVRAFLPSDPAWLAQVHGADVLVIDRNDTRPASAARRRADAAVTRLDEVVLAVRIADCLPVLLADRAGTTVGIAHAGWRGLAAGVLENTVAAMAHERRDIVAWCGPGIGPSAFEVGADVRDAFMRADPAAHIAFVEHGPGKWRADLVALARARLARAGVTSFHGGGMCTASAPARFFSFRRDRTSGRMAAFVWLARSTA